MMESLSDDMIIQQLIDRLAEIYSAARTTKLLGYVIPRWYTNPLYGGSYTNWPVRLQVHKYELNFGRLLRQESQPIAYGTPICKWHTHV